MQRLFATLASTFCDVSGPPPEDHAPPVWRNTSRPRVRTWIGGGSPAGGQPRLYTGRKISREGYTPHLRKKAPGGSSTGWGKGFPLRNLYGKRNHQTPLPPNCRKVTRELGVVSRSWATEISPAPPLCVMAAARGRIGAKVLQKLVQKKQTSAGAGDHLGRMADYLFRIFRTP